MATEDSALVRDVMAVESAREVPVGYMILCDGRSYQVVPIPEGAIPDLIIQEKYPGWIFVDDSSTTAEANSKIERDRAHRKPVWS